MSDFILPKYPEMNTIFETSIYFKNEEEKQSIHNNFKRVIFVGKSGIGKSTLLNMCYNHTFNLQVSTNPAKTSNSASGETSGILCYPNFSQKRIYIDTIGLTDNRFKHEHILSAIRSFIRGIIHGLHTILICINYGRIDADERRTLSMLEVIFGADVYQHSTIVTFNSPLFVNAEQWKLTLNDETIKLANCKNVLFINNTPGTNDIAVFQNLRKIFLQNFEEMMIQSHQLYKPADGLFERLYDYFQLVCPSLFAPDYKEIFSCYWKEVENDCIFCLCSIPKSQEIILYCDHTFHQRCLTTWKQHYHQQQKQEQRRSYPYFYCPICQKLDNWQDIKL